MDSQVLLGALYVALGLAFVFTRSRAAQRSRTLALVWLFLGVLLTANGTLKLVQSLS